MFLAAELLLGNSNVACGSWDETTARHCLSNWSAHVSNGEADDAARIRCYLQLSCGILGGPKRCL